MSTKRLATFHVGDLFFGVEVRRVREVIRDQQLTPVPRAPGAIAGLMNLRGQVVCALDLRRRTGRPVLAEDEPMNVVVMCDGEVVALLVDEIGDVVTVDDDCFETVPHTLAGAERELISGAYKLDDALLLVLDIERAMAST